MTKLIQRGKCKHKKQLNIFARKPVYYISGPIRVVDFSSVRKTLSPLFTNLKKNQEGQATGLYIFIPILRTLKKKLNLSNLIFFSLIYKKVN